MGVGRHAKGEVDAGFLVSKDAKAVLLAVQTSCYERQFQISHKIIRNEDISITDE